ncbi:hypothetical protein OUZ56_013717 [Daphnia magna]|uniref:Uncharacterized protein n=1 Tax=Daphnia magna TaxID=35525 RepID=A0ABQ9Z6Q6_9CRUS|nr:hypothetical protein OUZ56_013717 [Daphnia magna]
MTISTRSDLFNIHAQPLRSCVPFRIGSKQLQMHSSCVVHFLRVPVENSGSRTASVSSLPNIHRRCKCNTTRRKITAQIMVHLKHSYLQPFTPF